VNDTKSTQRDKLDDFKSDDPQLEDVSQAAAEQEFHEAGATDLPFEPAPVAETESAQTGDKADESLRQLLSFFFNGPKVSDTDTQASNDLPRPALLYQYRDLSRIRHDYPACLNEANTDSAVRSLTAVVDELVSEIADDSDVGQRMKQHIYRLESEIRSLVDSDHDAGFLGLWDRAAKKLMSSAKLSKEQKTLLQENLGAARRVLDLDYETIACDADAPIRLLSTLMVSHWQQRCQQWREQLELLIQQLQDILSVDFDHSAEAKSPEHLREATSTDDIDFDAMASILTTDHLASPIEQSRSERIRTTLEILLRIKPLFNPVVSTAEGDTALPFSIRTIFDDCSTAVDEYQARMRIMIEFFKAAGIARLEVENRYREALHDEFFSDFDISQLSADELALCPPVLLGLTNDSLTQSSIAELLEILSSGLPIKVLFLIDDLCLCKQAVDQTSLLFDWPTRLANMAMALNQVYVLQSPVSRLACLHNGMLDGLDYAGPALFSVYAGKMENRSSLTAFLDAAAAVESRAFPIFSFNPGKGETQAERMDVSGNSECDRDWPVESFNYRTADDDEVTIDLAFTLADFLLCDQRFAAQFRCIAAPQWHENMLPLHDYLPLNAEAAQARIPYLLTVDNEDRLGRVIMTRAIVELVRQCSAFWHSLQELGGVNNSFALNLLAEEKDRLGAEMQEQVDAIEKKYSVQLDQDIGKLSAEIIQRIAAQLVLDAADGAAMPIRTMAVPTGDSTPVPAATAQDIAAMETVPAEEEEEEEIEVLDDPYIETPRCTSCDDCTNLNSQLFAYDENKQAYIKDATAGPFKDLVRGAELCPVKIIHPGKPKDPEEPGLEALRQRAAPFM
jgi:uncharacterized coiled-coil protein SlyX/ferredoxin